MIKNLDKIIQDGVDRGLLQKFTSDEHLNSAEISIEENQYINFGSCSYLGLEYHSKLKEGVKHAVDQFGTQFSTSRTYLSIGLYDQLETELKNMFNQPVLATASTTLGHLAALPALIEDDDIVILDLQVHSSVQMAAQLLKARKVQVHLIPHNDMESLENKIKALSEKANRIWYMADGVYSMYGDFAPLDTLQKLLSKYDKLHLYIDDAHGMGWTGDNGTGYVRSQMDHHPKMVMATSLNKSFAASGGVLIFPNEEMYRKVKNCGTTLIFSGPIQPPMLGAGIESAKLHQSEEFKSLQAELKEKIEFTNRRLQELDLPQYKITESPLFFIPVGLPRVIRNIIKRMKKRGFFLNSASYPATPIKKGGIRFMINNHLSIEQIDQMLSTLREEYVNGLLEEGSSPQHVAQQFRITPFLSEYLHTPSPAFLQEELYTSANELDKTEWNTLFACNGLNEYQNLLELETVFKNQEKKEDNWEFGYHIVRDKKGQVILASVYSTSWMMDDLLADKNTSAKIKELRKENPYYLTSPTLMTGTPFTKGKSVYIDYQHDDWKEALKLHVEHLQQAAEKMNASKVILREFTSDQNSKLENYLMELGFMNLELPNNCAVTNMTWSTEQEMLQDMKQKYRYSLRKEILKKEEDFIVSTERPTTTEEKRHIYELYQTVHNRSTEISVFELPYILFERMYDNPNYDFIRLYLNDNPDQAVGVMISQVINGVYYAQLVGLDYDYVLSKGTYKQILYQTVKRAKALDCYRVDLAFTAEMEKKKVGAKIEPTVGYVMAFEHDSFVEMELLK